jgi:uroporphyrin-3 C-methyltransferase
VVQAQQQAQQSQEQVRDLLARWAILDARVAEVAVQRGQVEELIASLSRSRDENLLVDIDTGIRVAIQQSAITGSAEPLVATLMQSDERLARYKQPRLEGVRRAIAQDLDRVRSVGGLDASTLAIRLDEAVRMVDEMPLQSSLLSAQASAARSKALAAQQAKAAASGSGGASAVAPAQTVGADSDSSWGTRFWWWWKALGRDVWTEARSLIRVTRIEHPEAMLIAPDQAFFVRENLKLRLLNARLALMSRQFDTAQADLRQAQEALVKYFDASARRTQLVSESLATVAQQARQVDIPRPDESLAALRAAGVGR